MKQIPMSLSFKEFTSNPFEATVRRKFLFGRIGFIGPRRGNGLFNVSCVAKLLPE